MQLNESGLNMVWKTVLRQETERVQTTSDSTPLHPSRMTLSCCSRGYGSVEFGALCDQKLNATGISFSCNCHLDHSTEGAKTAASTVHVLVVCDLAEDLG